MAEQIDILWILVSAFLVFIMQAGFAFLESGLTRSKNSINVAIKNLTDLGVSILCYWAFGFALMFGTSVGGWFGGSEFLLSTGGAVWVGAFFIFQAMFCSTAATIVSGAVAERMRFASYIVSTILLAACIYPVLGHWIWGGALTGEVTGWLGGMGFVDFAGSTVVHSTGGWIALAVLVIIGPRTDRFDESGNPRAIPASNVPAAVVGVLLLWFGWFGFNGGSTLALTSDVPQILINTALAAAAGMVGTLAIGWPIFRIPDATLVLNGALAGLVAITAPAPFVDEAASIVIGVIGGAVMLLSQFALERLKIDDAVGAVPVHLVAGMWGTLAVALFGVPELLGTGLSFWEQLSVQAIGIVAAGVWSFGLALLLLLVINRFMPLRVTRDQEASGLNVAEHGASTELHDLFSVMEEQKRSGNLSLRVPEEPFTEVGQIARAYNAVLGSLEDNLVARSDYEQILDNVSDGLFLIDSDLRIGRSYSRALKSILGTEDLAGRRITDVLKPMLTEKMHQAARDFFELLFSPKADFRTVLKVNPLGAVDVFHAAEGGDLETRSLQFGVQRVLDSNNVVQRAMVVIRDVTEQVRLAEQVETERTRSRGEMELFYRILHVEPPLLRDFLSTVDRRLTQINATLQDDSGVLRERLQRIMEWVHGIKGDAALLNLDFIADKAHGFEDRISTMLRQSDDAPGEDFLSLAIQLSELQSLVENTRSLTARLSEFQAEFAADNIAAEMSEGELIEMGLQRIVERVARDTNKEVTLDTRGFDINLVPRSFREPLREALVQLARNAVVHGIEPPEVRTGVGKQSSGRISVSTTRQDDGVLVVSLRDDGRGFDIPLLRRRLAKEDGRPSPTIVSPEQLSDVEVVRRVLLGNLSATEHPDLNSGRGAGLSYVRRLVREIGGGVKLVFRAGKFCEFRLTFAGREP